MFHSRALNSKTNRIHEKYLRIIYNDKHYSFGELLKQNRSVSIHNRNLKVLAIGMFKVSNFISLIKFSKFFQISISNFNYPQLPKFTIPLLNSVYNCAENIFFLCPKIFELVPSELKKKKSLEAFKLNVKYWQPEYCPCRLCKFE